MKKLILHKKVEQVLVNKIALLARFANCKVIRFGNLFRRAKVTACRLLGNDYRSIEDWKPLFVNYEMVFIQLDAG